MRKVIIIIILAILLKPILPVVDYLINFQYFSKVLCENMSKPELECNGKCHLMKELAKASEAEKPLSSDKKSTAKNEIELLYYSQLNETNFKIIYGFTKNFIGDNYANLYFHRISCSVFHPPKSIS